MLVTGYLKTMIEVICDKVDYLEPASYTISRSNRLKTGELLQYVWKIDHTSFELKRIVRQNRFCVME